MTKNELDLYCMGWEVRRDGLERDLLGLPIDGGRLTPRAFERVYWCFYEFFDGWGSDGLKMFLAACVGDFESHVGKQWATDHTVAELVGFAVLYHNDPRVVVPLATFVKDCEGVYDPTSHGDRQMWGEVFCDCLARVVALVMRRSCINDKL